MSLASANFTFGSVDTDRPNVGHVHKLVKEAVELSTIKVSVEAQKYYLAYCHVMTDRTT